VIDDRRAEGGPEIPRRREARAALARGGGQARGRRGEPGSDSRGGRVRERDLGRRDALRLIAGRLRRLPGDGGRRPAGRGGGSGGSRLARSRRRRGTRAPQGAVVEEEGRPQDRVRPCARATASWPTSRGAPAASARTAAASTTPSCTRARAPSTWTPWRRSRSSTSAGSLRAVPRHRRVQLRVSLCQNWEIAQARPEQIPTRTSRRRMSRRSRARAARPSSPCTIHRAGRVGRVRPRHRRGREEGGVRTVVVSNGTSTRSRSRICAACSPP